MRGRSTILLALAVVSGLGAMFGTQFLSSGKKEETVAVLVAARDLNVEEVIKSDVVRVENRPRSSVPPGSIGDIRKADDRWVMVKMFEGEPIIENKLAPKGTPSGLVARIPKGMRAVAIEVNETTGVSGFVMPGHHVDVIQNRQEDARNKKPVAEPLLEDVLVLAAGQTLTRPEDKTILVRSVTLAVTPEDADMLVAAKMKGPLSLSLRGLAESKTKKIKKRPEPAKPATVPLVFAVRQLTAGDLVTLDAIETRDFPVEFAPRAGFSRPEAILGRKVVSMIVAGEPILNPKLLPIGAVETPPKKPKRSLTLAESSRSFTIEVDAKAGIDGKIVPGESKVDIYHTPKSGGDVSTAVSVKLLGNALIRESARTAEGDSKSGGNSAGSWAVTLEVPEEALPVLIAARESGTMTLALCPENDGGPIVPGRDEREPGPNARGVAMEVSAPPGLLEQLRGDRRVDLLLSREEDGKPASSPTASGTSSADPNRSAASESEYPEIETILQDARVLRAVAAGQGSLSVTLEVPIDELVHVTSARASGRLSLAVRAPGDHSRMPPKITKSPLPAYGHIYRGISEPERFLMGRRDRAAEPPGKSSAPPRILGH